MSEPMTDEEVVRLQYPNAYVCTFMNSEQTVHYAVLTHPSGSAIIGRGRDVQSAWSNAAQRIRSEIQ